MMSKYKLRFHSGYKHERYKFEQLLTLLSDVFEQSFKDVFEFGIDNVYQPYSFFYKGQLISNISLCEMTFIFCEKPVVFSGVLNVCTHPDYRNKGVFKQLFSKVLNEFSHDNSILLTSIPEAFHSFGYKRIEETYFSIAIQSNSQISDCKSLDIFKREHLVFLRSKFANRKKSTILRHALSNFDFFIINLISWAKEFLYYIPTLDLIIVFYMENTCLKIFDVFGKAIPPLMDILKCLPYEIEKVEVYFNPDDFKESFTELPFKSQQTLMHKGKIEIEQPFIMPLMSF